MKKPLRPCCRVGCDKLVDSGYCDDHKTSQDKYRGTAASRGYDSTWAKFRAMYIMKHPFCHDCEQQGIMTLARDLHHIHKLCDGGNRLDEDNILSLCHSCHTVRTNRGE